MAKSIDTQNKQQLQAFDLIANTNTTFFLTGRAGTGKTTFLKKVKKEVFKNFLVLAPTGIAAINAGGQTLHSFFGFPFSALPYGERGSLRHEKISLLNKMGLFDFWKKDTEVREAPAPVPEDPIVDDVLLQALLNGETITREKVLTLPVVNGAVDFISNCIASMPVKLYKTKDGKVEEMVMSHMITE